MFMELNGVIVALHLWRSYLKRLEMSQFSTIPLADPPESARELKKSWSLYEQKPAFDAK